MARDASVLVHMDAELKQRLRNNSANNGRSMSSTIEQLVRAHLDLADALSAEDTPQEIHNTAIITGEHRAIDFP